MTHPNRERLQAFLDAYEAKNRDLIGGGSGPRGGLARRGDPPVQR